MQPQFRVRHIVASFLFIALCCFLSDCEEEKPQPRVYPRLKSLPVSNITEEGATFSADLYSIGTEIITEHGYVWGTDSDPDFNHDNKILLGIPAGEGVFSTEIKSTLYEGKEYTVRPYVKTEEHIVYGPAVTFVSLGSLAPVITGFEPASAGWGDTLMITGRNFSWVNSHNLVKLSDINCSVVKSTDTTLFITIPNFLTVIESPLSVDLAGNRAEYFEKKFILIPPSLIDFYPKQGRWGDTLFIVGKKINYVNLASGDFVKLGSINSLVISNLYDTILIRVPDELNAISNVLSLNLNGFKISSQNFFTLLPPEIFSFTPDEGLKNSIVTIYGVFNPLIERGVIEVDNVVSNILYYCKDSIKFRIPRTIINYTSKIVYKSEPFIVTSPNSFNIVFPEIHHLEPLSAGFGEEVTIIGENLLSSAGNTMVEFGTGFSSVIKSLSKNEVIVYVPNTIDSIQRKIELQVGEDLILSSEYFTLAPPEITSYQPTNFVPGGILNISGKGFNTDKSLIKIYFDDYPLTITNLTNTEIIGSIPKSFPRNLSDLIVITGGYKRDYPLISELRSPWLNIEVPPNVLYYPASERGSGIAFSVGNKGYLLMPTNTFYSYDPTTNVFNSLGEQSLRVIGRVGAQQQDTFYLILPGWQKLSYRYNPQENSWTPFPSPPNAFYGFGTAFSLNNEIYYGLGCDEYGRLRDGSVYIYDSNTKKWILKSSFPWISTTTNRYAITNFTVNNKVYILFADTFFCEYDPETDTWTQKTSYPVDPSNYDVTTFVIKNKPYVGTGKKIGSSTYSDEFYNYDIDNNKWSNASFLFNEGIENYIYMPGGKRGGALSFVINNKAYIGFGYNYNYRYQDFYEFDPDYIP